MSDLMTDGMTAMSARTTSLEGQTYSVDSRLKRVGSNASRNQEFGGGGSGSGSKEFVNVKKMETQTLKNAHGFRRRRDSMENYCEIREPA